MRLNTKTYWLAVSHNVTLTWISGRDLKGLGAKMNLLKVNRQS
jgi:hypothetical protein